MIENPRDLFVIRVALRHVLSTDRRLFRERTTTERYRIAALEVLDKVERLRDRWPARRRRRANQAEADGSSRR